VIAVGALIVASNPDLLGTAGGQGRGNAFGLTSQAPAEQPPAEQPPAEQPPAEQPPAEQPPAEQPSAEQPPAEQPPAEQPPAVAQAATEQPPAEQPPVDNPDPDGDGITGSADECPDQGVNVGGDGCPLVESSSVVELTAVPPTAVPPTAIPPTSSGPVEAPPSPTPYDEPPTQMPTEALIPPTNAVPPTVELVEPPTLESVVEPTDTLPTDEPGAEGVGGQQEVIVTETPTDVAPTNVSDAPNEDSGSLGIDDQVLSDGQAVSSVQCFSYTVQAGDTFDILADLAQAAGSYTVDDIRLLNPGITGLQAGQTVCLPRVDRSGQTANARAVITGISFFCPGDAASMTRQRVIRVSFGGTTFSVFPGSVTLYYNGQVVRTRPFRIPGGDADGGFGFAADFPYQGPGIYRAVVTPTNALTDTGAEQSHECTYVYPTATPIPTNTPLPSIAVGQIVGGVAGATTPDSITGSCTPTEISFTVDGSSGALFAGSYVLVGPNGNPVANDSLDIFFDAKTVTNSVSSLVPGVYTINIDPGDGSGNILYAFECSAQSVGQVAAVPTDTPTPSPTPTNTPTPTATLDAIATGTQIANNMQATSDAYNAQQTQIATNLNATSVANQANTGGTATVVANQINATSTAVAGIVPPTITATTTPSSTPTPTETPTVIPTSTPEPLSATISVSCGTRGVVGIANWQGGDPTTNVTIRMFDPTDSVMYGRMTSVSTGSLRTPTMRYLGSGTYTVRLIQAGQVIAESQMTCIDPIDITATADAVATATQIANNMQATIDAVNVLQTQVVSNLNATAQANQNNTGGTATAVANQLSATGTAVAGIVPPTATLVAPATSTDAGVPPTQVVQVPATATVVAPATSTDAVPPTAGALNVPSTATLVAPATSTDAGVPPTQDVNVPATSVIPVQGTGVVIPSIGLNVHNAPNLTAQVVTALQQGTQVDIVGQTDDGGWLQIALPEDNLGWVVSYLVDSSTASQCTDITNAPDEIVAALDALLAEFLHPTPGEYLVDAPPAPGVVIRVESPDWIYYEAAGVANVQTLELLDCTMPFEIGSNTKMITATVLLQLQEEGLLNINDLLSEYLPDYAESLPFGDQITLRMLLNHTSGIWDYGDDIIGAGATGDTAALTRGYTPDDIVQFAIENGEPNFEPGAEGQWSYSNTPYVLLGIIIENLTGEKLETVFDERIFTPLAMNDSFLWNDVPQADFGLPEAYYTAPFDQDTITWNMSQGWAAGAVISTADDMSVFIRALLNGELFNNDDTLALMQETNFAESLLANYGLGIMSGLGQGDTWGHGGQTLGFESTVIYNVTNDISIVVWTNAAEDLAALGSFVTIGALKDAGIEP
jgi:D-alanyl-D-alanine carboxypeptidase